MRNKTSNIYTEWLPLIESLPNEQVGEIFKNILKYQNGEDIICDNSIWIFIKSKLDDYNNKGKKISETRKIVGKMGGLAKASKCKQKQANDSKASNKRKEKKRKKNKIKENIKENIKEKNNFGFIENSDWKNLFSEWIEYKKTQFRFVYASESSLQTAYNQLVSYSGDNLQTAKEIVGNSIANGYKGLFKPKEVNGNSRQPKKDTIESNDDEIRKFLNKNGE